MTSAPQKTLADLTERAALTEAPAMVAPLPLRPGGVDPLGLRQVNFDLMDRALPGLNNAATRLRPYVLVTWAWWKAAELGRQRGGRVDLDQLKGFVDRIEVLFVGSHIQAEEMEGLLGTRVLNRFRAGADRYECVGPRWEAFRRQRFNTSLMAPVAYGPSVKVGLGLGFLRSEADGLLVPMAEVMPAVRAFEEALGPIRNHPALSTLEGASVSLSELEFFHEHWRTSYLTDEERKVGRRRLHADPIAGGRRPTIDMIVEELRADGRPMAPDDLRQRLAVTRIDDRADPMNPSPRTIWRVLQTQQLFRYALEALLVWVLRSIGVRPLGLHELRAQLLPHVRGAAGQPFGAWLMEDGFGELDFDPIADPVALISLIEVRTWDEPWVSDALDGVRAALRIAAGELRGSPLFSAQPDRLPLSRALERAKLLADLSLEEALEVLISEWLIGQHIYWAVGRSGDETQRLRLVLDEGGWAAALTNPSFPEPTPDRLATVLSLMADVGLAERSSEGQFSAVS